MPVGIKMVVSNVKLLVVLQMLMKVVK